MSLMEAIEMAASGDSGLAPESKQQLESIAEPLELQVFVTPTCPYCPRAVVLAFKFAVQNANIHASMVEATEFPQLANRYQVGGVPHTVIGDGKQSMVGAYPEKAAVEMIVSGAHSS
jgi:glutaredoxin-like protein